MTSFDIWQLIINRSIAIMTFAIADLMINRRINTAVNRSKTFT